MIQKCRIVRPRVDAHDRRPHERDRVSPCVAVSRLTMHPKPPRAGTRGTRKAPGVRFPKFLAFSAFVNHGE